MLSNEGIEGWEEVLYVNTDQFISVRSYFLFQFLLVHVELFEVGHDWVAGALLVDLFEDGKVVGKALAFFFVLESCF
jgi:hypothetical protein